MKKTAGMIMACIGTVLSLIALFLYLKASNTTSTVRYLNIAALCCGALFLALSIKFGKKTWLGWLVSAAAVLMMAAFGYSLVTEVEVLGYLISGLRTWNDVKFWAFFSGAAILSWLVFMIASFTRLGEDKD